MLLHEGQQSDQPCKMPRGQQLVKSLDLGLVSRHSYGSIEWGPRPWSRAWCLPVSTSGSSLISFARGTSGSKLVNLLDLNLVC